MPPIVAEEDVDAVDAAVAVLRAGGTVVLPTDTVYGVAALARSSAAVDELYRLKGRPESVPIAVLVESLDQALELVQPPPPPVARLVEAFWPGPLTVVLDARAGGETVGVRCPDRAFVRAVAHRVGPLAVTSANRHGEPTPATATAAAGVLDGDVTLIVDGGPCAGTASTVVDGTDPSLTVLRPGPIDREQVRRAALR